MIASQHLTVTGTVKKKIRKVSTPTDEEEIKTFGGTSTTVYHRASFRVSH